MDFANAVSILSDLCREEKKISLASIEELILKLNLLREEQTAVFLNSDDHITKQYLDTVFYCVKHFIFNKTEINLIEQKQLVDILSSIIPLAIVPNLIKGVSSISNIKICIEDDLGILSEEQKFINLSCAIHGMMDLIHSSIELKSIVIKNYFGHLLSALYQLCYVPLQKPNTFNKNNNFVMTESFYTIVMENRNKHLAQLNYLLMNVCRVQVFQQLMMLLYRNKNSLPPMFFRKIVTQDLEKMLISDGGLESLILSLVSEDKFDTGKHWKNINMIVKLIKVKHSQLSEEKYFGNISLQVFKLFEKYINKTDSVQVITALACMNEFTKNDSLQQYAKNIIEKIIKPLRNSLDLKSYTQDYFTENSLKILHFCFVHESQLKLDSGLLKEHICVLCYVCNACSDQFKSITEDILYSYLQSLDYETYHKFLEMIIKEQSITNKETSKIYEQNLKVVIALLDKKNKNELLYYLFIYILKRLCNNLSDVVSKTVLIDLLMSLYEKAFIQDMLINEPDCLINSLELLLDERVKESHYLAEGENIINICLMILGTVIQNSNKNDFIKLTTVLGKLKEANISNEINLLIEELDLMINNKIKPKTADKFLCENLQNTPYSKALNDALDHLLPIRAHGILELGKLIQEHDTEAIAKKQYILCILQENLKHEDSYIYLAVIKALTEVSKACADEVIELLTQEYLENANNKIYNESLIELRLKVGEALVKVISKAEKPVLDKYKTLLLNTFLNATNDKDFLIQSSAYSNLGEMCKSLGDSLGAEIIFQILNKVKSCIENEKSPEVKRSSILLCTQLLRGLQNFQDKKEHNINLMVLKPSLSPLLWALKLSYENKEDETLKLHAELAIEELENIIKDFFNLSLDAR